MIITDIIQSIIVDLAETIVPTDEEDYVGEWTQLLNDLWGTPIDDKWDDV